eukprot:359374-Chlamydomonas_euryale.AAC.7
MASADGACRVLSIQSHVVHGYVVSVACGMHVLGSDGMLHGDVVSAACHIHIRVQMGCCMVTSSASHVTCTWGCKWVVSALFSWRAADFAWWPDHRTMVGCNSPPIRTGAGLQARLQVASQLGLLASKLSHERTLSHGRTPCIQAKRWEAHRPALPAAQGNKCAVLTLQLLGFDVDAINSVQFSNHAGAWHA